MKMTKTLAAMCGIAMAVCGCATKNKVGTGTPDDYKQCAESATTEDGCVFSAVYR